MKLRYPRLGCEGGSKRLPKPRKLGGMPAYRKTPAITFGVILEGKRRKRASPLGAPLLVSGP
jgi:hypothetical protein